MSEYSSTLKHPDVEEHIDLFFYRPLGYCLACLGRKLGWTPNAITIASIFLGIGCGLLLYPVDWRYNLVGMLLLVLADICDSADGQLARLTHRYSRLGRILDGASGDIWFIAIYICLVLRMWPEWGWSGFLLALCAGICHALQACIADRCRNFHLRVVNGSKMSEYETAAQVEAEYHRVSFRDEPLYKVFLYFYKGYTRTQERFCGQQLRLSYVMDEQWSDENGLREAFRQDSLPWMKWCNVLTFNWRAIILFVSVVLLAAPEYYFIAELTLGNLIFLMLVISYGQLCQFYANLDFESEEEPA